MTMSTDYKDYWHIGDYGKLGDVIFWSKDDTTAEDHMPIGKEIGLRSGSLAIMNTKCFRWLESKETWEEM